MMNGDDRMTGGRTSFTTVIGLLGYEKKLRKQVNKNILYEKVGAWDIGFDYDIGGVKSKETRSYQKGKCHSPIFSTFLGHVLFVC